MATKRGRTPRAPAAVWERGYRGHVLWAGKVKLGKVTLDGPGRYRWEAAGRTGETDALVAAKRAVEMAVAVAGRQRDLFE